MTFRAQGEGAPGAWQGTGGRSLNVLCGSELFGYRILQRLNRGRNEIQNPRNSQEDKPAASEAVRSPVPSSTFLCLTDRKPASSSGGSFLERVQFK